MSNNRLYLGIASTSIILLISIMAITAYNKRGKAITSSREPQQTTSSKVTPTPTPIRVQLTSDTTQWKTGRVYKVSLDFTELPEKVPPVFSIQVLYNPQQLKIQKVTEGNLWAESNLLRNIIDNQNGELKFDLGQGFTSDITGQTTLAVIDFLVLGGQGNSTINLGKDSAIAIMGEATPLTAEPFSVLLNQ